MYRPAELYTQPVTEPLSLTDVKAQLAIASSDTSHDAVLAAMIQEAREAWEHDTETVLCHQSFRIRLDSIFNGFSLPKKPVSSITISSTQRLVRLGWHTSKTSLSRLLDGTHGRLFTSAGTAKILRLFLGLQSELCCC
jgi:uncharacterized phiE125 gp8 family phage protein